MIGIIDTHTHIFSEKFNDEQDELIQRALDNNVTRMLVVCTDAKQVERTLEICKKYDFIDVAYGFHPTELNELNEADWEYLEKTIQNERVVALGEIGLDYYWDEVSKEVQDACFRRQMDLAKKYDLPVIIHMRDATQDTLAILKEYAPVKGIMHCYSGSVETAREVLKLGLSISLAGPLTFKNANHLLDVAKEVPLDKLFVETDAPYLTPAPHRGKRNEPAYVSYTLQKLCDLKEIPVSEAIPVMWNHYFELFKLNK